MRRTRGSRCSSASLPALQPLAPDEAAIAVTLDTGRRGGMQGGIDAIAARLAAAGGAGMRRIDVFNGDADGLCALRQLRLAEPRAALASW